MKRVTGRLQPRKRNKRPIDAGVEIGHVHLKTADIDRVRYFYVDVLGFDVVAELPQALFLSAGGYHHDLAFNTWESEGGEQPYPNMTGLYHVAIRYPSRGALGDGLLRLREAAWPLAGVNDHGTHEALYLSDPDGNGLELYWDKPEEEWPLDESGHLVFGGGRLDIEELLDVGKRYRRA